MRRRGRGVIAMHAPAAVRALWAAVVVLPMAAGACGADGASVHAAATGTYAADCGQGAAGPLDAPLLEARYLWKIGSSEDTTYHFGSLTDVAVDPSGSVYVLDTFSDRMSVYDSAGGFVRHVGRRGQGPGEFENPLRVRADGRSVSVFDAALWRVSRFDPRGELAEVRSPPAQPQFGQRDEVEFGPDGELFNLGYDRFQESLESARRGVAKGVFRGTNVVQRWDPEGGRWIDLARIAGREVYADFSSGYLTDVPFPRRALWTVAPQGFWTADSGTGEVRRHGSGGNALCAVRLEVQAPAVTRADRRRFRLAADLRDRPMDRVEAARRERKEIPIPATRPTLAALASSRGGDLWVQLTPAGDSPPARETWYVFDPDGSLRERVSLPAGFRPRSIEGGRVTGIEVDSEGVHHVAALRYR